MKYLAVIFDFDGTLANTIEAGAHIYNGIAEKKGFNMITRENQLALRSMAPRSAIKKLGVKFYQIPKVALEIRNGLRKQLMDLKIFPGIPETLSELKNKGLKIFLASSNSKENVETFISQKNLGRFFDGIFCGSGVFGKSKTLHKLLKENGLDAAQTLFVADEIRDIEAARKENMAIACVTWGLNSRGALMQNKPDFIIDEPVQLLNIA